MVSETEKESKEVNVPAVEFIDVVKYFGDWGQRHRVLHGVSYSVPKGKTTVIAGGSGQGKSVTLKLVLGLLKPDSGRILVDGQDVTRLGRKKLRDLRMKFGVLFQGEVDIFTEVSQIKDSKKPYIREFAEMTLGDLF
ncbi:MAG: ATP-binding cassette domain-containing protein [Candidatus Electrothrix sp. AUS4]|nr:ATP-binding cassette domain-containing protein [Candidatus Electrothrix sp. AUS4]